MQIQNHIHQYIKKSSSVHKSNLTANTKQTYIVIPVVPTANISSVTSTKISELFFKL